MISCWCAMHTAIWSPVKGHILEQCCAQILFEQPLGIGCIVEESYRYNLLKISHICTRNACQYKFCTPDFWEGLSSYNDTGTNILLHMKVCWIIKSDDFFSHSGYYHASKWKCIKSCDFWDQRVVRYSTTIDVRTLCLWCILVCLITSRADWII